MEMGGFLAEKKQEGAPFYQLPKSKPGFNGIDLMAPVVPFVRPSSVEMFFVSMTGMSTKRGNSNGRPPVLVLGSDFNDAFSSSCTFLILSVVFETKTLDV